MPDTSAPLATLNALFSRVLVDCACVYSASITAHQRAFHTANDATENANCSPAGPLKPRPVALRAAGGLESEDLEEEEKISQKGF